MSIYEHKQFISLPSDTMIWRYIDLEKFKSLLKTKSLFFCRADKFSDPFEGSIPRKEFEHRLYQQKQSFQQLGIAYNEAKALKNISGLSHEHQSLKSATLINCWHINNSESDAMWRLYLKDNEGVAIQTTVKRLNDCLKIIPEKVGISKVRYIDYENDVWYHPIDYPHRNYNTYIPLIHKRIEFIHESELRLILDIPEAQTNTLFWDKQPNDKGNFIQVDIENLIEKVYLPPTADKDTINKIKKVSTQLGRNFIFEKSILKSKPYY